MERVVTINLNGNPYQLEEPAYDAVRAYLTRAETALASNPDKAEILRDLEQAIADKCKSYLSATKSVVSASEMTKALEEMGPVEGDVSGEGPQAGAGAGGAAPRKRLFRIRDDAQIAGVCAGIAAYFDIDVNIIRLVFIIMTLITSGGFLLVYIAMMFLVPSAHTSEEWAAAHGVPFNAQEVIDRAKREYAQFTGPDGPPWRWRGEQRRAWRREMKNRARAWASGWTPAQTTAPLGAMSYGARIVAGIFAIVFGILRAALAVIFFVALFTLVTTGSFGYWPLPAHVEIWQAVLGLVLVYAAIAVPLRVLTHVTYSGLGGHPYYWGYRSGSGFISLVFFGLFLWFAYNYFPEARQVMEHFPDALIRFGEGLRDAVNNALADN